MADTQQGEQQTTQTVNLSDLTQEQGLAILVNGINIAQRRGAFNLKESSVLSAAVDKFVVFQSTMNSVSANVVRAYD